MLRPFSEAMLMSIESQIKHCHETRGILDVYKAAEAVRRENLPENVALEDIVSHFVSNVGNRCSIEFVSEFADRIIESQFRSSSLKRRPLTNEDAQ